MVPKTIPANPALMTSQTYFRSKEILSQENRIL